MALRSKNPTEYEQQRLENIRHNDEMMSALMLQRKATDLASFFLKPKKPKKPKPKSQTPIVIRRSLRTRGISPSPTPAAGDPPPKPPPCTLPSRKRGPILTRDAFVYGPHDSDTGLVDAILNSSAGWGSGSVRKEWFDPRSELVLRPENVAKVVNDKIMIVRFLPFGDRTVIAVGNNFGSLGFWDVNFAGGDGDGIYVYQPHSGSVSGISVHPFSPRKIFTSGYDGFVRLMDVEKESFNMIISSDYDFYSICQWPHDINSLYVGEGVGMLKVWDEREGKDLSFWELHEDRINSVDFSPENVHLMATSSTDGLACIWDLRRMKKHKPESIKSVNHSRAVHSAYFSPSGKYLATTSIDNKIRILSGANFDDLSLISHYHWTGKSLSNFRAIWGWDDSYLFIGNMKRAIDVISTSDEKITALKSPDMTSIPSEFAAHPYKLGYLAGATTYGKVFLWTKE